MSKTYPYDDGCLAVIGMAARLPGANNIREFWDNLLAGRQSMEPIPDEILATGLHAQTRFEPDYVAMRSTLKDFDLFDADFFGFSPRDASIMDPQHRLVLEYAWRAFENAGYAPGDTNGIRTGVYASSDMSGYLTGYLYHHILSGTVDVTEAVIGCDKDYLASRIAYKCNLKGPAMAVQSSCSSSLLSVHIACQALLSEDCDRALVTACTVMLPEDLGYIYLPGGMRSPDGRCRPYDVKANGTIFANGVIAVLLKRLNDAKRDKDNIIAVVRATAATNDGFDKVGYTAPSVNGQASAISSALSLAGVDPLDVSFVEGHGTATPLGDPIEVAALKQAYASEGKKPESPIILGSLKGNIGHLDTAAGLVSFAKTALCLQHGVVPGTANFTEPNPAFGDTAPFVISRDNVPLHGKRASLLGGVSAFGIGGTNVHAVLQEAPPQPKRSVPSVRVPLLFSAHNEQAFDLTRERLAAHLSSNHETSLIDAAFTLAEGRRPQIFRGVAVAKNLHEAISLLHEDDVPHITTETDVPVAFLFPGQGNLHPDMARTFYTEEEDFRQHLHELSAICAEAGGPNLTELLKGCWERNETSLNALTETETAQPLLFALELALAQTLIKRGIRPACMIGHSLGEYTAACVAGVFSPEEGMRLVTQRGALMQTAPRGKMLVVSLHASRIREVLGSAFTGVEISLINSAANCVLTGPEDILTACAEAVTEHGQRTTWLKTSHAFHSASMEYVLEPFRELMRSVTLHSPEIPYVSNLTGTWIGNEVTDPEYWVRHLRSTVQFADGLAALRQRARIGIEVGPGNVLRSLAAQQAGEKLRIVPGLDPLGGTVEHSSTLPVRSLANIAADIWLQGGEIDWETYYASLNAYRCALPETSFTPRRYWITPGGEAVPGHTETGEHNKGLKKYARSCRNTYVSPETDVERALVTLWQELLFVDHIGIKDDFLELGGNSIQVMQMVRQAASQGLNFTSKDVFDAGNIQELAKRVRSGIAVREVVPGPVPTPPYLITRLKGEQGVFCHYRVFSCPKGFNTDAVGRLARTLATRHDALRMAWTGTELRLAGVREIDWALNNVDNLGSALDVDPSLRDRILSGDCQKLAAELRPERLKGWSLTLLPGDTPLLLLLVRSALADVPAMHTLEQDILKFLQTGNLSAQSGTSWKLWLEELTEKASISPMKLSVPESGTAATPWNISEEPGIEEERREIGMMVAEDIYVQLKEAAAFCRATIEEMLGATLGVCLAQDNSKGSLAYFINEGRHLAMPSSDPTTTVGSFTLRHGVSIPANLRPEEAIPHFKGKLRAFSESGVAPWLTDYNEQYANVTLFWLGEQPAHKHHESSENPEVLRSGSWTPATSHRESTFDLIFWVENESLHVRFDYPARIEAQAKSLLDSFIRELEAVIVEGLNNPTASRYCVADFPDSELSESDLTIILSQLKGE